MARGVLSWLGSIYDLDTLDTRFTTPSSVPYTVRSNSPTGREDKRDDGRSKGEPAPPPRWTSPEFIFYYLMLSWIIPYMFWVAYTVSRGMSPFIFCIWPTADALFPRVRSSVLQIRTLAIRRLDCWPQNCMLDLPLPPPSLPWLLVAN